MSTSLRLVFKSAGGNDLSMTYSYADPSVDASSVKSVMEAIVDHGDIFAEPPVSIVGAELISRVVTELDLSGS